MAEIWTAMVKTGDRITFNVLDEATGESRQETRHEEALPLMIVPRLYHYR
jgi:hypothetical protein